MQLLAGGTVFDQGKFDHFHIAIVIEIAGLVPYISHTAAHAGGKVPSRPTEHNDAASGHIFATVVSDTFHNGDSSAVPYTEAFADTAIDVDFPAGCPI